MPIQALNTESVGLVGIIPRLIYIQTNDTLAEIITAGYLNQAVSNGFTVSAMDMALVTGSNICNGVAGPNWFQVVISGNAQPYTYSLAEINAY